MSCTRHRSCPARFAALLAFLPLTGVLAAQEVVLPSAAGLATTEGNSRYTGLFCGESGQHRFMQIEEDLRTKQSFTSIAFRRDGFGTFPISFPRVAEIEILMGLGSHDGFTATFDSNYLPYTRLLVYDRNFVNLPDARTPPVTPPAGFMPAIPFDRPFYFDATGDLLWEIKVYTTFPYRTEYPLDAHEAVPKQTLNHSYGVGCIANKTLPVMPMSLYSGGVVYSPQQETVLNFFVDRGPPDVPTALLWSISEDQQTIPGLCTNVYVKHPIVVLPMPATNAAGTTSLEVRLPYVDEFDGLKACNQAFALDMNQQFPIQLAASNGTRIEVLPPTPRAKSISVPLVATATDPDGVEFGHALVVRLGNSNR